MFSKELKESIKSEVEGLYDPLISYHGEYEKSLEDDSLSINEKLFKEYYPDGVTYTDTSGAAYQGSGSGNHLAVGGLSEQVWQAYSVDRELALRRRLKSDYYFEALLEHSSEVAVLTELKVNKVSIVL